MDDRRRILLAEITPRVPQAATFATWNAADKHPDVALSAGNLTATKAAGWLEWGCVRATLPMYAGAWYWETLYLYTGASDIETGLAFTNWSLYDPPGAFGSLARGVGINRAGQIRIGNAVVGNVGVIANGVRLRHWFDADSGTYRVANGAGAWVDVVGPTPGYFLRTAQYPILGLMPAKDVSAACTANFGATPFAYPVPAGVQLGVYEQPALVPTTVYLGSEGFNTGASDVPASKHYMGRIAGDQDVQIQRGVSCWVWGGQTQSKRGQVVVLNADGALDAWAGWRWRDASITLYAGYAGDTRGAFTVWSRGLVEDVLVSSDKSRFTIVIADPLARLDKPLQSLLYPDTTANVQLRGQARPVVLGRPLFCEPVLVDTAEIGATARTYHLNDRALREVTRVFDKGDVFAGPGDPYVANNPVTLANGGTFDSWANDASGVLMPSNWTRWTAFGATNDRFQQGAVAGAVRLLSGGQLATTIRHASASLLAGYRYTISFTVKAVSTPGQIAFRAYAAPTPTSQRANAEVVVALATTGPVSTTLDVPFAAQLHIGLGLTELDAEIDDLTVSSTQVIDWTIVQSASFETIGFKLANKPAGRITADPVGAFTYGANDTFDSFDSWSGGNPLGWSIVNGPETAQKQVMQNGSSARFSVTVGTVGSIGIERNASQLIAGRSYQYSIAVSAYTAGAVLLLCGSSLTELGRLDRAGSFAGTFIAPVSGKLRLVSLGNAITDLSIDSVSVIEFRILDGLPDWLTHLLVHRAGLPLADIDLASAAAVDAGIANASGITDFRLAAYIRQPVTILQLLRDTMDSFCGWCVPNRLGVLRFGSIRDPKRVGASIVLNKANVAADPIITPDLANGLTTRIKGRRNNAVHGDGDIATSASAELVEQLKAEYLQTVTASPVLTAAGTKPISDALAQAIDAPARATLLQEASGLQAIANTVASRWREDRNFYRVTVLMRAAQGDLVEPGQTALLTWDRYGLDAGKELLIIDVATSFFDRRVELVLWG